MKRFFRVLPLMAAVMVISSCDKEDDDAVSYESSLECYRDVDGGEVTLTTSAFFNSMYETSKIYASDSGAGGADFDGVLFYSNDGEAGYNALYLSSKQTWVGFAISQNFASSVSQVTSEGTSNYNYEFFANTSTDADGDHTFVVGHYVSNFTPTITFSEPKDLESISVAIPAISASHNPSTMWNDYLSATLVATAKDAQGVQIGEPVSKVLFNSSYVAKVRWWEEMDLSELDGVSSLEFTVQTDNSSIPTYLCIDALLFR
ncbi:MAG: DUF4465 domain-containing protein [Rikenellaceae bacterium]